MRQGNREWTLEDFEQLKALVRTGALPFRASVALSRSMIQVKKKARELGCPFPHLRAVKARTREILAGDEKGNGWSASRSRNLQRHAPLWLVDRMASGPLTWILIRTLHPQK